MSIGIGNGTPRVLVHGAAWYCSLQYSIRPVLVQVLVRVELEVAASAGMYVIHVHVLVSRSRSLALCIAVTSWLSRLDGTLITARRE